jgi:hypothetical protein
MSAPAEQRGGFGRGAARGGDRGRGGAFMLSSCRNGEEGGHVESHSVGFKNTQQYAVGKRME